MCWERGVSEWVLESNNVNLTYEQFYILLMFLMIYFIYIYSLTWCEFVYFSLIHFHFKHVQEVWMCAWMKNTIQLFLRLYLFKRCLAQTKHLTQQKFPFDWIKPAQTRQPDVWPIWHLRDLVIWSRPPKLVRKDIKINGSHHYTQFLKDLTCSVRETLTLIIAD